MKKLYAALAAVAMTLLPAALSAKTVTFTVDDPDAVYLNDTWDQKYITFDGKTSVEAQINDNAEIDILTNSGYELTNVTVDETTIRLFGTSYCNLYPENLPDGSTVSISTAKKEAKIIYVIGDPSQISLKLDYTDVFDASNIVDGKWTLKATGDYPYLSVDCSSDYILKSITDSKDNDVLDSWSVGKSSTSISLSQFESGEILTVECSTLSELRTTHVSLEVVEGNNDEIIVRRNGIYDAIPSTQWGDIALNPASELPLTISAADYGKSLYKVTVNDVEQTPSYAGFELNTLNDGDKIKVWPNFPDVDVPVSFTFTNEGTSGVVKSITLNGEPVEGRAWEAEGYTVKLGSNMYVNFDTGNYSVESVTVNGAAESTYSYSTTVTSAEALNIVITATQKQPFKVKLTYEPGTILVYNSYGTENEIALPADKDEVTIEIPQGDNYINIVAAEGYKMSEVINATTQEKVYIPYTVTGDVELLVYTEEFARDQTCVIYLQEDIAWDYKTVTLSRNEYNLRKEIILETGYNFVNYAESERPLYLGFYPYPDVYLNGEKIANEYGDYPALNEMAPNSVLKIFAENTEVSNYNLTISNESEGNVSLMADYVNTIETAEATVFGPTDIEFVVTIASADESSDAATPAYTIKVNDTEVTANDEGRFIASITADSTIEITKKESDDNGDQDGIVEISNDKSTQIYNLQGMKVSNPKKGIFISNGKKIVL